MWDAWCEIEQESFLAVANKNRHPQVDLLCAVYQDSNGTHPRILHIIYWVHPCAGLVGSRVSQDPIWLSVGGISLSRQRIFVRQRQQYAHFSCVQWDESLRPNICAEPFLLEPRLAWVQFKWLPARISLSLNVWPYQESNCKMRIANHDNIIKKRNPIISALLRQLLCIITKARDAARLSIIHYETHATATAKRNIHCS